MDFLLLKNRPWGEDEFFIPYLTLIKGVSLQYADSGSPVDTPLTTGTNGRSTADRCFTTPST